MPPMMPRIVSANHAHAAVAINNLVFGLLRNYSTDYTPEARRLRPRPRP